MPLYEYECDACHQRFEKIQKFSDPLLEVCAKCGKGPVRKLLSSPAIQFKGSGWYITDYARAKESKGTKESKEPAKESKEPAKESKESSSTDSAAKTTTKTE